MGINVRVQKSPKPLDVIEVQAKLERDLRSCMRCRFFYGNNRQSFTGNYEDWAQTLIYLCEMTFTIALTVGSVKGAQSLTNKALGL